MSVIDKFMPLLMEKEEEGLLTPILQTPECTFAYIKTNNLYIVSISSKNANIALIFVFLYKIASVFVEYFKELEEESIRDNFVVIYELLDELIDFGYPQTTDSKILQEYITQEGHKLEIQPKIPLTVTNAVSWRSEGIKYRKNEVFLDVIESVNLLANANGNVLRSEIVGAIKMRVYLSGMPELRLGLNDKVLFESTGRGKSKSVELEDVKFHQCVRLSRFENDRTISFIPPDGEFELMSYRLNTHVKPLIWIESVIERFAHSRVEYMIKAKSQFKRRSTANNVEIVIPVPGDADSPKFKTTIGSVKYVPEQNAIIWTIKSFPGGKEFLMRAHFGLPSVECEDSEGKPPIQVKFEIPYFTTSGIQVFVFFWFVNIQAIMVYNSPSGTLFKNHRKERLPGVTLGAIYYTERGLPAANQLVEKCCFCRDTHKYFIKIPFYLLYAISTLNFLLFKYFQFSYDLPDKECFLFA